MVLCSISVAVALADPQPMDPSVEHCAENHGRNTCCLREFQPKPAAGGERQRCPAAGVAADEGQSCGVKEPVRRKAFLRRHRLCWCRVCTVGGESPAKGCEDEEGTGASLLGGEAEGAGLVQPGEEKAARGPSKCP